MEMTTEGFELKILRPYLEKVEQPYFYTYKIELVDGSRYFLSNQQNEIFQRFMVYSAHNYFLNQQNTNNLIEKMIKP